MIGGGPSLRGFPFHLLKDEKVVAVNRAHECGVANVIVTGDRRWLVNYAHFEKIDKQIPIVYIRQNMTDLDKEKQTYQDRLRAQRAHREDITSQFPYKAPAGCMVYHLVCRKGNLWGTTLLDGLSMGGSGIRAVNFAAALGADPIYLLGFDMGAGSTVRHQEWWHDGYSRKNGLHYEDFLKHWEEVMSSGLVTTRIINLSSPSNLTCVPQQSWKEVLSEQSESGDRSGSAKQVGGAGR